MSSSTEKKQPAMDAAQDEVDHMFEGRRSLSIRTRLRAGFILWFVLTLGIVIAMLVILKQIRTKLLFMQSADRYSFEIQQARRFEKNYFLYHTNLDDALDHTRRAKSILDENSADIEAVVGKGHFRTMTGHVKRYEQLLGKLAALDRGGDAAGGAPAGQKGIETELREHGAEMVRVAEDLAARERRSVNSMLLISQGITVAFLAVLFLLIVLLALFIDRQMLAPLGRMVEAAKRFAAGDFAPIKPKRRYRDELTELAIAMNHMMSQLIHRHELLVQAHKLKAVGTLTAGVAHELNNPINNIMLTAAMLLEDYTELSDGERLEMVNDLVGQSERARRIVRNLLDFARESEIQSEPHAVRDIIEETLQLAANQIKLAKVKVKGEVAENLPPVYGDRQQLTQVFLNMVLNALDAMPGGGTLSISVDTSKDRDFIVVELRDTGDGIPDHLLRSIFDPFFTTKSGVKGTGLGLSVSLGIIKQHGGNIRVESREGEGSAFTVLLPIAKVPADISNDLIE